MNIKYLLAVPPFISCLLVACSGFFVFVQSGRSGVHFTFTALCSVLSVYNAGVFFMYILDDPDAAFIAARSCAASTALLTALLPHFIIAIILQNGGNQSCVKLKLFFFYSLALSIAAASAFKGPVIKNVVSAPTGFISTGGPYFFLYTAALSISGIYSIFILYRTQAASDDYDRKISLRHVLLGIFICFLFGLFDMLKKIAGIFTAISTLEYGIIAFCALSAFSIARHKFLNVEFAVKKGALYSILMIFVALTVLSVAVAAEQVTQNWLDTGSFIINLLNALIVGFFFEPVKDRLQMFLNKYFFPRLTGMQLDPSLINNKAILEYIAFEKIDELKLIKTNIEKVIENYENKNGRN